eukprot:TRINITY_DN3162_c0_g1_i1.p1 TRINITY_DN3162_c0_g1~~TRINITY_DN3162_c0_g1_i1.p1  ORF type:complete len:509 (+),score=64.66 TRINITY_DN3162_c0_g1_i1:190-1716(+)
MKVGFLLTVCLLSLVCLNNGEELMNLLGTKTPYKQLQNYSDYTAPPPGYSISLINLVARHGSRHPTAGMYQDFEDLETILQKHAPAIINPNFAWMKKWVNPFNAYTPGYLVLPGEIEHFEIGSRFTDYYLPVFNLSFITSRFSIYSSEVSRSGRSANSFSFGLFHGKGKVGPDGYDPFYTPTLNKTADVLMRFFDNCPTYVEDIKNNKSANAESTKYKDKVLPKIISHITTLLELDNAWALTASEVLTMWNVCGFELSILNQSNNFCQIFQSLLNETTNETNYIDDLNYIEDLNSYYIKGYGYELSWNISCLLLTNIVTSIDNALTYPNTSDPNYNLKANLGFGHAETVLPLLAMLGLYKDPFILTANTSTEQIRSRLWKDSNLATFASNVAINLYTSSSAGSEPLIKVLHNEKEMILPKCDNKLYCPLSKFKSIYSQWINQCNFNQMCHVDSLCEKKDTEDLNKEYLILSLVCGFVVGVLVTGLGSFLVIRVFGTRKNHYGSLNDGF